MESDEGGEAMDSDDGGPLMECHGGQVNSQGGPLVVLPSSGEPLSLVVLSSSGAPLWVFVFSSSGEPLPGAPHRANGCLRLARFYPACCLQYEARLPFRFPSSMVRMSDDEEHVAQPCSSSVVQPWHDWSIYDWNNLNCLYCGVSLKGRWQVWSDDEQSVQCRRCSANELAAQKREWELRQVALRLLEASNAEVPARNCWADRVRNGRQYA